ncbi:MAG: lyase family protein, partial [Gemmatimonadales bacterium]
LRAVDAGELVIGTEHEDVHSAVEFWLTRHFGDAGARIHTGRSRNDQVSVDLRLFLKDAVLGLHDRMTTLADTLLDFARVHRRVIWPGYTHQRIAMPSSAGLWAAGYAEGLLDAADSINGFWTRLDRSPLGSAAGYGVPLPLAREAAARALGFGGVDLAVTSTQNGRGVVEAEVIFWCCMAAHECAKLSSDVILFSADEFAWLTLPRRWSTGSSIMPQKRNPDLFELTRARAVALEGDLATIMALKSKLGGGYHRDFQLLKAPLFRGLDRSGEMLSVLAAVIPELGVDVTRARAALRPEVFATDEVMRRVRSGAAFRTAYRDVSREVTEGRQQAPITTQQLLAFRRSTGGLGNLPFAALRARLNAARRWRLGAERRFRGAITRLVAARRS